MRLALLVAVVFCLPVCACNMNEPVKEAQKVNAKTTSEARDPAAPHDSMPRVHAHQAHAVTAATHDSHAHARDSHDQTPHQHAKSIEDQAAHAPAAPQDGGNHHGHSPARAHDHPKQNRNGHYSDKQKHDAAKVTAADTANSALAEVAEDDLVNLPAAEIFDRRILPIARSHQASSCTECHFGGVELKNYVHDDQATTFTTLRDEGLIDVEHPEQSKILQFIRRHGEQTDSLKAKVRQGEYQAFRTWILAAVRDPQLLAAKSTGAKIGNQLPVEVIRHMRRDRVLRSFVENIWFEVGRCINCHSPERNERLVGKHGEQISWIRPADPAGTLQQCLDQGIIDTDSPEESLILLKPLVLVEHGGGPKFALGSRTDKNFRRFLNDFAAVMNKKYERQDQLPTPPVNVTAQTGQHLRIVDLPDGLDKKLLKADIYRWIENEWSEVPWGTAENPINGKTNMWQSMVMALAPRGSKRADEFKESNQVQLPSGRYLVKIYIDEQDNTKNDRNYELGAAEFFGQVESDGDWAPGYQPPKIVQARQGSQARLLLKGELQ